LTAFKTVTDNSGARSYVGVWRDQGSAQYLWTGVDKENFLAKNNELVSGGLRLAGIVTYSGSCSSSGTNLVICGCSGYTLHTVCQHLLQHDHRYVELLSYSSGYY
jgi:hypothetical protein